MNVKIDERWGQFLRSQGQSGRDPSPDAVAEQALRLLERRDADHARDRSEVEALLLQGLDSGPSTPMSTLDWDDIGREGQRWIAVRKARCAGESSSGRRDLASKPKGRANPGVDA